MKHPKKPRSASPKKLSRRMPLHLSLDAAIDRECPRVSPDRFLVFAVLYQPALRVFESPAAARAFLHDPHPLLGGHSPTEHIACALKEVFEVLALFA